MDVLHVDPDDGTVLVGGGGRQTACPDCGETDIERHELSIVEAGECPECLNVWQIGLAVPDAAEVAD